MNAFCKAAVVTPRCRHRLPSPEDAGFCDVTNPETGEVVILAVDALKEAAARYPRLRPCPRCKGSHGTWNWTERQRCERCPDAVENLPNTTTRGHHA